MIDGNIEAGPNAVLAFKKKAITFLTSTLAKLCKLCYGQVQKDCCKIWKNRNGRNASFTFKVCIYKGIAKLLPEIQENDLVPGGSGVRAQACDRNGGLIDDFDIVKNGNIIHVRNAPSPAATSCLSIGNKISELIMN
jgi:L-2-hydroxyglutarate oxidase